MRNPFLPQPPNLTELPRLSFDPYELLEEVRADFPDLTGHKIEIWLHPQKHLACIEHRENCGCIRLHSLLNHPQTPRPVLKFILQHELLHLRIPPREVEGKRKDHPPEFWKEEVALAPKRSLMWAWIRTSYGYYLRSDKKREAMMVKPGWKKIRDTPKRSLEVMLKEFGYPPNAAEDEPLF